jgi:lysophospholipase L1-like esterase
MGMVRPGFSRAGFLQAGFLRARLGGKIEDVATVGDSITRYVNSNPLPASGLFDAGYQTHARVRTGSGFDLVANPDDGGRGYFATSGGRLYYQTNITIPDHIDEAIAAGAKTIFGHFGTNDVRNGSDAEDFGAAYAVEVAKVQAAGRVFIGSTLLGPSPEISDPAQKANYAAHNEVIRGLGLSMGFPVVDFAAATATGTPGETQAIYIGAAFGGDNLHPTPLGMSVMGETLAAYFDPRLKKAAIKQVWNDIASGAYGLELSGGYLFPGFTSGIPNGYSFTLGAGGTSATHSRVAADDGLGDWWQVTIVDSSKTAAHTLTARSTPGLGHKGTAQTGGASTITLASGASASNNAYAAANRNDWIWITAGTGAGQVRRITGYVGATKVATVDVAWVTVPDATSVYEVGTRTGERYFAACEVEFDPAFECRGDGLLVRSQLSPQNIGDSHSGGASISIMPEDQVPFVRPAVYRTFVEAVSGTADRFSCRFLVVGQGVLRIRRFWMGALDRTEGQLTFTP